MLKIKEMFSKRILCVTLSLTLIFSTCFIGAGIQATAAEVTATSSHTVYSNDFTDPETLDDFIWAAEGNASHTAFTASIADGSMTFNNTNGSGSYLHGMRFLPDKKYTEQRVELTFDAQKGLKPCLWARVSQDTAGDSKSCYGYYVLFNCNADGSLNLKLSKRLGNLDSEIGNVGCSAITVGQEYRMEMVVQGTNPTLISVSLYTKYKDIEDTVIAHNTFVDNEARLQSAGSAGLSAARTSAVTETSVSVKSFEFTSTDNVTGRYYVEEGSVGTKTFGQVVVLDPTKKYVFAAHSADNGLMTTSSGVTTENVNPLWIEYFNTGNSGTRALISNENLSSNREESKEVSAGIEYNEYFTVFYNEFDLSTVTDKKIETGLGDKTRVIVGFRCDGKSSTTGRFSHFTLYAADDENKTNLLVNPDFKMGLYGWNDAAGSYMNYTQMKESVGTATNGHITLSNALTEYEYYKTFKNSGFTVVQGDASRDGAVDIRDLVATKKLAIGIVDEYRAAVDYDNNSSILASDLSCLRKQLLGISLESLNQVNVSASDVLSSVEAEQNISLGTGYTADYALKSGDAVAAITFNTPKNLRFKFKISDDELKNAKECGAVIALENDVYGYELEIGAKVYAYTKAVAFNEADGLNALLDVTDTAKQYAISLNGITEGDFDKQFTLRPYVIYNDDTVVYGDTVTQSVYGVAVEAAYDTASEYSTTERGEFLKIAEDHSLDANGASVNLGTGNNKVVEIENLSNDRISEIRGADSDYTASGNVYYVSASGNDSNSGKSASAPWKTLSKVNNASLSNGDVVLFNRGDVFRGSLTIKNGVTYSAYGEGAKPRIYGSSANAADSSKWTKHSGGDNIWVYSEEMLDVGLIVFNDGESYAEKVAPFFINGKFTDSKGNAFDLTTALDGNYKFFSDCDSVTAETVVNETTGETKVYPVPSKAKGKLYLYCEEGNPGDIFDSIEICQYGNIISGSKVENAIIDNLCVMYGGSHAIGIDIATDFTVRNCEIGWIGGSVLRYNTTSGRAARYGNGVQVVSDANGFDVTNNYIYQIFDTGITHQQGSLLGSNCEFSDISYTDNVIENCEWSIEYFMNTPNAGFTHKMSNIDISNNIMRLSGFGFGQYRDDPFHYSSHIMSWWDTTSTNNADGETITIKDNILDRGKDKMIEIHAEKQTSVPVLSGNTFIQNVDATFGRYGSDDVNMYAVDSLYNNTVYKVIDGIDDNAKVYFTDIVGEMDAKTLAQGTYFLENPVKEVYGFTVQLANRKAVRYLKVLSNDVRITETKIKSLNGNTTGAPVKVAFFSDTHFVGPLTEADQTKQHLVDLYNLRKNTFRNTVKSTPVSLAFGDLFDRTVIGGDLFDFYSEGNINLFKQTVTDKYPDVLTLLGNHEGSEGFSGISPETPTNIKDIYADLNSRVFGYGDIKESGTFTTLAEAEEYNDIYLAHNLVKDALGNEKALLLMMDNQNYTYQFDECHYERLNFYINYAKTHNIPVLIFQHTPLTTGRTSEVVSPYDIINNGNGVGENWGTSASPALAGSPYHDTRNPMTSAVYNLIVNNADVIKGIFCGHVHNNIYTEIVAKTSDGTDTVIPQYTIAGNYFYSNINLITIE